MAMKLTVTLEEAAGMVPGLAAAWQAGVQSFPTYNHFTAAARAIRNQARAAGVNVI